MEIFLSFCLFFAFFYERFISLAFFFLSRKNAAGENHNEAFDNLSRFFLALLRLCRSVELCGTPTKTHTHSMSKVIFADETT